MIITNAIQRIEQSRDKAVKATSSTFLKKLITEIAADEIEKYRELLVIKNLN